VDLTLDAHEREVASAARSLLGQIINTETLRSVEDAQSAEAVRKAMLGIGSGGWLAGPGEKGDLFTRLSFFAESGAALAPGLVSMAVGAAVLADLRGDAAVRTEIESGTALVSALTCYAFDPGTSTATLDDDGSGQLRISGVVPMVEFGAIADLFYIVAQDARRPGRQACVLIDARRHEIERRGRSTFGNDFRADLVLDVALDSSDVSCTSDQDQWAKVQTAKDVIAAIRAVECAGGARAVTRRTVNYVNTRHQFGKPLAQFQAVKQRAANMLILSEGAFLLASEALAKVSEGLPRPVELEWAKSWVARAYKDVTLSAHQLHGGMGYARESDLFRWSERAKLRQLELEAEVDRGMFATRLSRLFR
jgi:alkylation response protein AidB-like acyl-CoA dehydrogenase